IRTLGADHIRQPLCFTKYPAEYAGNAVLCRIKALVNTKQEDKIMAIFEGAGVALITPMKADGQVNYDKLGELIEEQIAGGTDAIIACGTTGEASTLTHEEHLEVIRYTCQKTAGRIPV